ncbi:hypothetical protein PoB_006882400 [Plakobranchus ocellatus]|uniref:Uncharacterized protein n=1 Tax=Plakobranchus ocellatus TaxID=259542 RepID=A0AAV4DDP1_9GAST|nr:hypothetical protein PoB_006882400 [Plakobranchus ocellatus]
MWAFTSSFQTATLFLFKRPRLFLDVQKPCKKIIKGEIDIIPRHAGVRLQPLPLCATDKLTITGQQIDATDDHSSASTIRLTKTHYNEILLLIVSFLRLKFVRGIAQMVERLADIRKITDTVLNLVTILYLLPVSDYRCKDEGNKGSKGKRLSDALEHPRFATIVPNMGLT